MHARFTEPRRRHERAPQISSLKVTQLVHGGRLHGRPGPRTRDGAPRITRTGDRRGRDHRPAGRWARMCAECRGRPATCLLACFGLFCATRIFVVTKPLSVGHVLRPGVQRRAAGVCSAAVVRRAWRGLRRLADTLSVQCAGRCGGRVIESMIGGAFIVVGPVGV